jgi:hypothetical protein
MKIEFDTDEIFEVGDPFKATKTFDDLMALLANPLIRYSLIQFGKGIAITLAFAALKYGYTYMQNGGFDKLKEHFETN